MRSRSVLPKVWQFVVLNQSAFDSDKTDCGYCLLCDIFFDPFDDSCPAKCGSGTVASTTSPTTTISSGCAHSSQCPTNQYCDQSKTCYDCTYCKFFNDEIDGACPACYDETSTGSSSSTVATTTATTKAVTTQPPVSSTSTTGGCSKHADCQVGEYCTQFHGLLRF